MEKEIYEIPKVEIVDLDAEGAMCQSVINTSYFINQKYSGANNKSWYGSDAERLEMEDGNAIIDYDSNPFAGGNRGF